MLCYVMLCYVMLCYVMLCYVMLCYIIVYYIILKSPQSMHYDLRLRRRRRSRLHIDQLTTLFSFVYIKGFKSAITIVAVRLAEHYHEQETARWGVRV